MSNLRNKMDSDSDSGDENILPPSPRVQRARTPKNISLDTSCAENCDGINPTKLFSDIKKFVVPVLVLLSAGLLTYSMSYLYDWTSDGISKMIKFTFFEAIYYVIQQIISGSLFSIWQSPYGLIVQVIPFTTLWFVTRTERSLHILSLAGVVNFAFFFYAWVTSNDISPIQDIASTTAGLKILGDSLSLSLVCITFILLESYRYDTMGVGITFVLGGIFMFGFDAVTPLFFAYLKGLEEAEDTEETTKRKRRNFAWLYALEILIVLWIFLPYTYKWAADPIPFAKKIEGLTLNWTTKRLFYGLSVMLMALITNTMPQIQVCNCAETWYLRIVQFILIIFNLGIGMASFCLIRELTDGCNLRTKRHKERVFGEPRAPFYVSLVGRILGVYVYFVVGSALGYALSSNVFQVTVILTLILLFLDYITNSCVFSEKQSAALAKWISENLFTVITEFIVSFMILVVSWGDSTLMPRNIQLFLISWKNTIWYLCCIIGGIIVGHMVYGILRKNGSPLPRRWKILIILSFILFLFSCFRSIQSPCPYVVGKEYLPDTESEWEIDFSRTIANMVSDTKVGSHQASRLQHQKMHGCVLGDFTVNKLLPPQLKHGIFSSPNANYKAIIRYSNGARVEQSDSSPDVKAMAIKLMDVSGEKSLLEHETGFENSTQDFILLSSDVFFTNDILSYPDLMKATALGNMALLKWVFPSWNPLEWRLRTVMLIYKLGNEGLNVLNPLDWSYFSTTPYRLGKETAVKYKARPCFGYPPSNLKEEDLQRKEIDPNNYLRANMQSYLSSNDICFEFMVQTQEDACAQPIEDPTVPWTNGWASVARIVIPKQNFLKVDQINYCNALSFNPWHSLKEHRPLGAVNFARKPAYSAASYMRQKLNGLQVTNPKASDFDNFKGRELVDPLKGAGDTKRFNYARYAYPHEGLPKHIAVMPSDQGFDKESHRRMINWNIKLTVAFLARAHDPSNKKFSDYTEIDDYVHMFGGTDTWIASSIELPKIEKRWKSDEEFARQFISGVNPLSIRVARKEDPLPEDLNLNPKHLELINTKLQEANPSGNDTLQSLLEKGRIFFADYTILTGITMKDNRLFYSPIVVFYLDHMKRLMPLCIQLTRDSSYENEIFIAPNKDSATGEMKYYHDYSGTSAVNHSNVWMFARMHAMSSDGLVHEMLSHLCFTHLAMEPVVIAFYRQLSAEHPILQLFKPHFRNTLAINDFGRETLLAGAGSIFDRATSCGLRGSLDLMLKGFQTKFFLMNRAFPEELRSRGFHEIKEPGSEGDNLPGYYYRDDGFRIWRALKKYITTVVTNIYGTGEAANAKIKKDIELQALRRELVDPEFAAVPGVPKLERVEVLIEFLSTILFTCTAQHSAVNFGQYDFYAFVPNRPLVLTKPMPDDKSLVTTPYILAALPNQGQTEDAITVARVLSLQTLELVDPLTNQTLGYTIASLPLPEDFPYREQYTELMADLRVVSQVIEARNEKLGDLEYPYLTPHEIASSIAI